MAYEKKSAFAGNSIPRVRFSEAEGKNLQIGVKIKFLHVSNSISTLNMEFLLALFGHNVHGAMKNNAISCTSIKSEKRRKFVGH